MKAWLILGFVGQALFSSRFAWQWWVSERQGRSVIPPAFWWLSLAGGGCLLVYSIWRQDPVFIVGQLGGLLVYSRNLVLLRRAEAEQG